MFRFNDNCYCTFISRTIDFSDSKSSVNVLVLLCMCVDFFFHLSTAFIPEKLPQTNNDMGAIL